MNTTTTTRRIRTAAFVSAVTVAATMVASPAMAQHPRDDVSSAQVSAAGPLGYGTELVALDGQTLVQYLQQHQASDRRTATVI